MRLSNFYQSAYQSLIKAGVDGEMQRSGGFNEHFELILHLTQNHATVGQVCQMVFESRETGNDLGSESESGHSVRNALLGLGNLNQNPTTQLL
jgi:hypothetical protein